MTKFLLFAALFVSTTICGQNLDGIMDIKFGSSIGVVKKAMLARPGCVINEKRSDSSYLYFSEVRFSAPAGVPQPFLSQPPPPVNAAVWSPTNGKTSIRNPVFIYMA